MGSAIGSAAARDADRAAAAAGVEVRPLRTLPEQAQARAIWDAVWTGVPGATEITSNLLRAIEHAGGYLSGAFEGTQMVGACLAIIGRSPADPARPTDPAAWTTYLHSHMAATLPGYADRGIGTALKLHQRAWALDRGIDRITWTFDPLVRRNAQLNLHKLAGVCTEYLVDFYGTLDDERNAGDDSDRLILRWDIASDAVADAVAGRRRPQRTDQQWVAAGARTLVVDASAGPLAAPASGPVAADESPDAPALALVAIPADIVAMRRTDPGLARVWRRQVRAVLLPVLAGGGRIVGLTADGSYVVEMGR